MRCGWALLLAGSLVLPASVCAQELAEIPPVDLANRVPARWLASDYERFPVHPARRRRRLPRRCRTRGGYRQFCSGERLVPTPFGPAAALAAHLGLGERASAMVLMHQPPFDEWLEAVRDLDPESRLTFPVPTGRIGRGFGYTRDEGLRHVRHDGVDIGAPLGASIVAARGGLVMYADNGITGMGNAVILLHRDGASTLYAHCRAIHVFAGQYVSRGEVIAEVGQTGFANAPHLHFEWRLRGRVRDPRRLFLPRTPERDHEGGGGPERAGP
jgi:murein DD-endopeptidase MepM/ murein hydrolase activator NlpD